MLDWHLPLHVKNVWHCLNYIDGFNTHPAYLTSFLRQHDDNETVKMVEDSCAGIAVFPYMCL